MAFAQRLQELRSEHRLSQEQLAEICQVSRQAVSKWESGISYPEIEKSLLLCDHFEVSLDYLLRDGDTDSPAPVPEGRTETAYAGFVGKTVRILLNDKVFQGIYRAEVTAICNGHLLFQVKNRRGILRLSDIASISETGNGGKRTKQDFAEAGCLSDEGNPYVCMEGRRCIIRLKSSSLLSQPQGFFRVQLVSAANDELVLLQRDNRSVVRLSDVLLVIES